MPNVDLALVEQVFDVSNDSGYLTYITARRITLGAELKWRNGEAGWRGRGIQRHYPRLLTKRGICSDKPIEALEHRRVVSRVQDLVERPNHHDQDEAQLQEQ